ncbi:MAG TPA: hypothetical protein VGC92_06795 [Phenylobacterium sp.]|jgi:hypothetical protein
MRIRALILLVAIATPVWGQPAPTPAPARAPDDDIIGSLLDPRHKATALEEEEPDTAGQKPTQAEPDLAPTPPPGRNARVVPYAPPPRPQLDRPVHLEETGRTPDRPPTVRDLAYESRVRASFAAAEGYQGPLDGGWTLSVGSDDLFALQIVDKADRLEGVWRDLRRKGSLDASGVVDEMQRQGQDLTLRFVARRDGRPTVATLHAQADGRWTGNLEDAGERKAVVLRRTGL